MEHLHLYYIRHSLGTILFSLTCVIASSISFHKCLLYFLLWAVLRRSGVEWKYDK
jgi:hypothetical protein